jgi:hypothetical protein
MVDFSFGIGIYSRLLLRIVPTFVLRSDRLLALSFDLHFGLFCFLNSFSASKIEAQNI